MRGIVFFSVLLAAAASVRAQESEFPSDLGDRVRDILVRRCAECHGSELGKPKGGFGFVDDLDRVAAKYVSKANPDESELWWALNGEPELMPPAKKGGPLPVPELALIRWWIEVGAPLPALVSEAPVQEDPSTLGPFHVLLVHFPVALLPVALLAELLFIFLRGDGFRTASRLCLVLGVLAACLAVVSGWGAAEDLGPTPEELDTHRWIGVSVAGVGLIALFLMRARERRWVALFRTLLFLAAGLVTVAGHFGGLLVHGVSPFGF